MLFAKWQEQRSQCWHHGHGYDQRTKQAQQYGQCHWEKELARASIQHQDRQINDGYDQFAKQRWLAHFNGRIEYDRLTRFAGF